MYGIKSTGGANGVVLAYFMKLTLAAYAVAYHEYGFRLPELPDLTLLTNLL